MLKGSKRIGWYCSCIVDKGTFAFAAAAAAVVHARAAFPRAAAVFARAVFARTATACFHQIFSFFLHVCLQVGKVLLKGHLFASFLVFLRFSFGFFSTRWHG